MKKKCLLKIVSNWKFLKIMQIFKRTNKLRHFRQIYKKKYTQKCNVIKKSISLGKRKENSL